MAEIQSNTAKKLYNIGFVSKGIYITTYGTKSRKSYSVWKDILRRCYDEKTQEKFSAYKGCSISEEWYDFQNFARWYENNHIEEFQIDKDILIKWNKIYSSETCCFVPQEINSLFTKKSSKRGKYPIGVIKRNRKKPYEANINKNGKCLYLGVYLTEEEAFQAYKEAKEKHIKEVADKWKDLINNKVYQAMYNYQVEITD